MASSFTQSKNQSLYNSPRCFSLFPPLISFLITLLLQSLYFSYIGLLASPKTGVPNPWGFRSAGDEQRVSEQSFSSASHHFPLLALPSAPLQTPSLPSPGKNCSPWNQPLMPKRLGTVVSKHQMTEYSLSAESAIFRRFLHGFKSLVKFYLLSESLLDQLNVTSKGTRAWTNPCHLLLLYCLHSNQEEFLYLL